MTKHPNIDQKLNQIFAVLLGVVDNVTSHKDAFESIRKIVNDEK